MRTDRQKNASIRNRCKYVLYKFRYISFGFVYMSDNNDTPFTDEERKIFAEIRKSILILEKKLARKYN